MHILPIIRRPPGHYRELASGIAASALLAVVPCWLAMNVPAVVWHLVGLEPEHILRGLAISANPATWFGLTSNLALIATVALWWPWAHAFLVRKASAMEIAAAPVLGTILGFTLAGRWILRVPEIQDETVGYVVLVVACYLILSVIVRALVPRDVEHEGKAMKALWSLAALSLFLLCQHVLVGMGAPSS